MKLMIERDEKLMKSLTISEICKVLPNNKITKPFDEFAGLKAAVSIILRMNGGSIEILFILRALRHGDPWSGQIAFPGGHSEPQDQSMRETAERETSEEIGIDLNKVAKYLGEIEPISAIPRKTRKELRVYPFVYLLNDPEPFVDLNYEVSEIIWGSLIDMYRGNSQTEYMFKMDGKEQSFPGYDLGAHTVWGLTYRMIHIFFEAADSDWQFNLSKRS